MLEPEPQRFLVVHAPFATCGLDLYTGLELMGSDMCVMPCRRSTVKLLLHPMVTSEVKSLQTLSICRMVSISRSQSGFWVFAVCTAVSLVEA